MDGTDLAREGKMRWPLLRAILTSGHPLERVGELPPAAVRCAMVLLKMALHTEQIQE
jgi:hypothetical protein